MDAHPEPEIEGLRALWWHPRRDPRGHGFASLADAYRRAGQVTRALEVVDEGLARLPEFATGHLVAGWVLRDAGRADEAAGAFRRVMDLDPGNGAAREALAALEPAPEAPAAAAPSGASSDGRAEAPAPAASRPPLSRSGPLPTRTLAELYVRQGQIDAAREVYRDLIARSPGDSGLERRLAELDGNGPTVAEYFARLLGDRSGAGAAR